MLWFMQRSYDNRLVTAVWNGNCVFSWLSHLALKTKDGDTQTHKSSDTNAQHYRFCVVETVGNNRTQYKYNKCVWMSSESIFKDTCWHI